MKCAALRSMTWQIRDHTDGKWLNRVRLHFCSSKFNWRSKFKNWCTYYTCEGLNLVEFGFKARGKLNWTSELMNGLTCTGNLLLFRPISTWMTDWPTPVSPVTLMMNIAEFGPVTFSWLPRLARVLFAYSCLWNVGCVGTPHATNGNYHAGSTSHSEPQYVTEFRVVISFVSILREVRYDMTWDI